MIKRMFRIFLWIFQEAISPPYNTHRPWNYFHVAYHSGWVVVAVTTAVANFLNRLAWITTERPEPGLNNLASGPA